MPTRLWGDVQRARYGRFPDAIGEDDIARCFHLDERDQALITELRGAHNRLGFAAQLGTVRFIGTFPSETTTVPPVVLDALARQLAETPAVSLDDYWNGRQRWRHVALIRERYGFRDFADASYERFRLTRWLYALCWAGDDRPGLLIERAVAWLLAEQVLLPGVSTLERFCAHVRARVHEQRWRRMAGAFDTEQSAHIARLFDSGDGPALIEELRCAPRRLAPGEFMTHLERIDAIRAAGLAPKDAPDAPDAVIERLAHAARKIRPAALARLPEPRRSATLAALFGALERIALDEALELFDQLVDQTVKDAAKTYVASRMRTLRDLDAAALILAQAVESVLLEERDDASLRQALAQIRSAAIENAIERTRHLARPPDDRHFQELCTSWRRIRRLFEGLLRRIAFEATPVAEPVREALVFLAHTPDWTRASMRAAPTACVSAAWSRHVFDLGAKPLAATVADNRAYVFAVLEATRKALRRRDIFVAASARFADPNRGMLDDAAWASARPAVLRALGRSDDARAEIGILCEQLDAAYQRANTNLPHNPDLRFENDDLVLSHLDKLEEPPTLIALRRDIQARLPKGDLPDIVLEVCTRTDLADSFIHVNERGARVADLQISLAAVLVAQSCNIGFEPMVRPDIPALHRDRLSWVSQNFIRNETLRAANAKLVASHDALPIVRLWGSGDVASADGVRFIVRGQPIHAGYNPKYFGRKRGVTWYNLVSDQSTGLGGVSVPGTLRDSMVILGLLLEQETHFDPREVMTDTAAYSDVVFGLFWVLGYRFSPRLADIGGARFWRIDRNADYGAFDRLARNQVNTELIAAAWPDLLRLAGSLKLGRVKADAVMRILQVKERPTPLARALAELGRIVKTIHVLDYVNDAEKRRRILVQLNRQEYRHRLARRVCHGRRGELTAGYREGQEEKLGALGLMLNVIAFWNATYMQAVVENLQAHGRSVNPGELARVSPLAYRHINFLGRYAFTLPEAVARGELRSLRDPNSE